MNGAQPLVYRDARSIDTMLDESIAHGVRVAARLVHTDNDFARARWNARHAWSS
jgi:hypothetical protein